MAKQEARRRVVFVCEHGAAKSLIATADRDKSRLSAVLPSANVPWRGSAGCVVRPGSGRV